jgi:heme-degrading monooxygenase HmoA
VHDPDGGFSVSVWDTLDSRQAYEQSAVFRQEIQPMLHLFFRESIFPKTVFRRGYVDTWRLC